MRLFYLSRLIQFNSIQPNEECWRQIWHDVRKMKKSFFYPIQFDR